MWYFFLFYVCLVGSLSAQRPYFQQITDEDGLPSMEIFDLFQDSKGYIWIGSNGGIARYDGRRFESFVNKEQRRIAMSNIMEGPDGRIWTRNFGGQIFYVENDSLHLFQPWAAIEGYQNLNEFTVDGDNRIWMSVRAEVWLFDVLSGRLMRNYDYNAISYIHQIKPASGKKGVYLITEGGGVHHLQGLAEEGVGKVLIAHQNMGRDRFGFVEHPQGTFYLAKQGARSVYRFSDGKLDTIQKENKGPNIIGLRADSQGDVWMLDYQGVQCLTAHSRQLFGKDKLLKGKAVSDFLQDDQGNYWVSTLRSGLFRFASREIVVFDTEMGSLTDERINVLSKGPNGALLLGNNMGSVDCFDPRFGKVTRVYQTAHSRDVEAVYYDAWAKQIYASCQDTYIFNEKEDKATRRLYRRAADDYWLSDDGWLAIASSGRLSVERVRAPVPRALKSHWPADKEPIKDDEGAKLSSLFRGRAKALANVPYRRELWVALEDRMMVLDYGNGQSRGLQAPDTGEPLLGVCMSLGADSSLWLGTVNQGLYQFKKDGTWRHFEQKDGLNSNFVRSLACNERYLWLGSYNGLQSFDLKREAWRSYTREDGLSSNEVKDIVLLGDTVWLATSKGLNALLETAVHKSEKAPPIYLKGFSVFEQPRSDWTELRLAYNENNIRIDFLGLDFRNQDQLRYKYRLIGLDSNWTESNRESNLARYPSLPAGDYRFEVRSLNGDGLESAESAVLRFSIAPPFWERWWFFALLLLGISALVFLFFRYRIRQLQNRNALAQEKTQAEQELRLSQLAALRVQMNPHFIFNALNSIQEFIFLNEKRQANNYIGKFSDLMRLTLTASSKQQVTLADELKVLRLYLDLEKVRFEEALDIFIEVEEQLNLEAIFIPPLLIQPYVENAIKHGLLHRKSGRKLQISFYPLEAQLLGCTIEDNGIGRKRSEELKKHRVGKKGAGFSMSATQRRLDLLNYNRSSLAQKHISVEVVDLYDEQQQGIGTRVLLRIPYSHGQRNEHGI